MSGNVHPNSADVQDRQYQPDLRLLHKLGLAPDWGAVNQVEARQEARRVRQARRLTLVLMLCSSLFSVAVLYGLWVLAGRFV